MAAGNIAAACARRSRWRCIRGPPPLLHSRRSASRKPRYCRANPGVRLDSREHKLAPLVRRKMDLRLLPRQSDPTARLAQCPPSAKTPTALRLPKPLARPLAPPFPPETDPTWRPAPVELEMSFGNRELYPSRKSAGYAGATPLPQSVAAYWSFATRSR